MRCSIRTLILGAATLLGAETLQAQTCSCAAAPVLSSLEGAAAPTGRWRFGATYQYHAADDFVVGSKQRSDGTERNRATQSLVLEVGRGIGRGFSATALLPIVRHEREVASPFGGSTGLTTSGTGDVLLMIRYAPFRLYGLSRRGLAFGVGAKAPTGVSGATSGGITVAEDMQPGSGAWDGVLWARGSTAINRGGTLSAFATASYRYSGRNDREYRFGTVSLLSAGFVHHLTGWLAYTAVARYRHARADARSGASIPNTGGDWVYVVPGVSVRPLPEMAIRASVDLPVYRHIRGAQFTTSIAAALAVAYTM